MEFSEQNISLTLVLSCGSIVALIFALRGYFNQKARQLISENEKQSMASFIKKHPKVDVLKWSSSFYLVGLIVSIGLAIVIMSWTTEEQIKEYHPDFCGFHIIEIEQDIPITYSVPIPPPPPMTVIEVIEDELIEDEIDFSDIDNYEWLEVEPFFNEEEESTEEVFTVVEDMPCFPGCEDLPTNDERKKCTETNLLKFMYKNFKYPSFARESGIEGLIVVTFIIAKDGAVQSVKCLNEPSPEVGNEAIRVIRMMNEMPPKWRAGKQRGKSVNVRYNLPIRFSLSQN